MGSGLEGRVAWTRWYECGQGWYRSDKRRYQRGYICQSQGQSARSRPEVLAKRMQAQQAGLGWVLVYDDVCGKDECSYTVAMFLLCEGAEKQKEWQNKQTSSATKCVCMYGEQSRF